MEICPNMPYYARKCTEQYRLPDGYPIGTGRQGWPDHPGCVHVDLGLAVLFQEKGKYYTAVVDQDVEVDDEPGDALFPRSKGTVSPLFEIGEAAYNSLKTEQESILQSFGEQVYALSVAFVGKTSNSGKLEYCSRPSQKALDYGKGLGKGKGWRKDPSAIARLNMCDSSLKKEAHVFRVSSESASNSYPGWKDFDPENSGKVVSIALKVFPEGPNEVVELLHQGNLFKDFFEDLDSRPEIGKGIGKKGKGKGATPFPLDADGFDLAAYLRLQNTHFENSLFLSAANYGEMVRSARKEYSGQTGKQKPEIDVVVEKVGARIKNELPDADASPFPDDKAVVEISNTLVNVYGFVRQSWWLKSDDDPFQVFAIPKAVAKPRLESISWWSDDINAQVLADQRTKGVPVRRFFEKLTDATSGSSSTPITLENQHFSGLRLIRAMQELGGGPFPPGWTIEKESGTGDKVAEAMRESKVLRNHDDVGEALIYALMKLNPVRYFYP